MTTTMQMVTGGGDSFFPTTTCPTTTATPTTTTNTAPPSHPHHLTLGQACLEVTSADPNETLQLWGQAEECYKCSPWYYFSLSPGETHTIVANTSYPTNLYITAENGTNLYSLQYHFGEYGNYRLSVGTSATSPHMAVTQQPENIYMPLLSAFLFFFLLTFIWQCMKLIGRRMDSPPSSPPPTRTTTTTRNKQRKNTTTTTTTSEISASSDRYPLLSPDADTETEDTHTHTEPQASTSSSQPPQNTDSHPHASTSSDNPISTSSSSTTTANTNNSKSESTSASASVYSPAPASSPPLPSPLLPTHSIVQTLVLPPIATPLPVPESSRSAPGSGRLVSLDAFRGLAIVLMVFVNYGGGRYTFFNHARWNGLTVADLVFPWFLWIMGVSLVFSVRSQLRRTTKRFAIVLRILKRCLILFALGLVVNSIGGHNHLPTFRILGVLQRFAICYLVTAVLEVYAMNPQESPEYVWYWKIRDLVRSSPQWLATLLLVTLHVALTFALPVPGCPTGYLGPGGLHENGTHHGCTGGAAGYIDRRVLGAKHVYHRPSCASVYGRDVPYDPEGLLGALTSVLVVQLGAACGRIILTFQTHIERVSRWLIWAGVMGVLAGVLCDWRKEGGLIPVNKNLWSVSYVLCTASFAFLLFSIFYLLIDWRKWWSGIPLRYAGMNAIMLYVGHEVCRELFPWSWRPVGQHHSNYLAMNLWATSLWIVIAYLCHRRKIYLSV